MSQNKAKPCRCGSGLYCHRHLCYGTDGKIGPKISKVRPSRRPKAGARSQSMGGQH